MSIPMIALPPFSLVCLSKFRIASVFPVSNFLSYDPLLVPVKSANDELSELNKPVPSTTSDDITSKYSTILYPSKLNPVVVNMPHSSLRTYNIDSTLITSIFPPSFIGIQITSSSLSWEPTTSSIGTFTV